MSYMHSPVPAGQQSQPAPPPRWQRWSHQKGSSWWKSGPLRPRNTPGCSPSPDSGYLQVVQTLLRSWKGAAPSPAGKEEVIKMTESVNGPFLHIYACIDLSLSLSLHLIHLSPCSRPFGSGQYCVLLLASSHPQQSCGHQGHTAGWENALLVT